MSEEVWKPVPDYEGRYEMSSFGRVKSLQRLDRRGRPWPERVLKPFHDKDRYLLVKFSKDSKQWTGKVHILVAKAFVPNPLNLPEVNHEDGDKNNCRADNLTWTTGIGNLSHALRTGLKTKTTSNYYGVAKVIRSRNYKHWVARITLDRGKTVILRKWFSTELEAAQAYNAAVITHGLDHPLNDL